MCQPFPILKIDSFGLFGRRLVYLLQFLCSYFPPLNDILIDVFVEFLQATMVTES